MKHLISLKYTVQDISMVVLFTYKMMVPLSKELTMFQQYLFTIEFHYGVYELNRQEVQGGRWCREVC